MKKIVSIIAIVLTICAMMSVALIPAFASGGLVRERETQIHTSAAHAENHSPSITTTELPWEKGSTELGATINETNPTTYIIVAIGIFVVAMGLGVLIGYNIKKKKPALAEGNGNKDEE